MLHADFAERLMDCAPAQGDPLDNLMEDLRQQALQNRYAELRDDDEVIDPVQLIAEQSVQVVAEDEITELQRAEGECSKFEEKPLFPSSPRFLGSVILLLCCFVIRFRLSDECLNALLCLIEFVLPAENTLFTSLYGVRRFLAKYVSMPEIQYFCNFCYTHVSKDAKVCSNSSCLKDLTQTNALAYFVKHSVIKQLSVMFKRKSFADTVRTHRFKYARNGGKLYDVYDGSSYRKLYDNGFLKEKNNISFAFNTDGVAIFKSSPVSMWPVYLLVNELPLKQRKSRHNIIMYGVWISPKKPAMWSFLKPLYEELKELEKGVQLQDYTENYFTCCATLLSCTCDLPARCMVSNGSQFNGKHSCWYCHDEGSSFRTPAGGNCHIFPFTKEDQRPEKRSCNSHSDDVQAVVCKLQSGQTNPVVRGIKGPCWFMFLKHFDIINGFCIDYMHCICAGIVKGLLGRWFSKEHKGEDYSAYGSLQEADRLLQQIKPNLSVSRVPRSLQDLVHWKSSEFRNFLFYWGVPVLQQILKTQYYLHFCLLVRAVYLLSREGVTSADLDIADACLVQFVDTGQFLYSPRILTMNVHMLLHLVDNVKANGPLFVNNCFAFEDFNGYITDHIHGTQNVQNQVLNTITMVQAIPVLHAKFIVPLSQEDLLYTDLMSTDVLDTSRNGTCLEDGIYCLGASKGSELSGPEFVIVRNRFQILSPHVITFDRVYFQREKFVVYGSNYRRMVKRQQSVIKYTDGTNGGALGFGNVQCFIRFVDSCHTVQNVALVKSFKLQSSFNANDHIHHVTPVQEIDRVVRVADIKSCCMHVKTGKDFICEQVNKFDRD